jgi:hypothetical protein
MHADASAEVDSILEEQRTLDGAGKDDKQSLLALVSEVRPAAASSSRVVKAGEREGGYHSRVAEQQGWWCVVVAQTKFLNTL